MNVKREYVPENESPSAPETMRDVSRHIEYLINEGYDLKQVFRF